MEKIKETILMNELFFLLLVAVLTTSLNVSILFSFIMLILIVSLAYLPTLQKKEYNYAELMEETLEHWFKTSSTKANDLIREQKEKAEMAKEQEAKQRLLMESEYIEAIQEKASNSLPIEQREAILTELALLNEDQQSILTLALANESVSNEAVFQALNNLPKEARETVQSSLEQLRIENETHQVTLKQSLSPNLGEAAVGEFQYTKKGKYINLFIYASGLLVLGLLYVFLVSMGLPLELSGATTVVVLLFMLIDLVYFLPTLLYNASTGGKILMFLVNGLLGITVIGWIVLLVIAVSRNNNEKRQQELMHYIKHK